MHIHRKTESIPISRKDRWNETEVNSVQKFHSKLVDKPCDLLTRHRNQRYRLSHSRDRLSSVPYPPLTSCIFLIPRGCVLFVWLGDWAGREQGEGIRINSTKPQSTPAPIL